MDQHNVLNEMKNVPRVLHVITELNIGGAELLLKRILLEYQMPHSSVVIVSLKKPEALGDELRALGFTIYGLNISGVLDAPKGILKLGYLIRRFKPDIVHTWLYHADFIGGLIAKLMGVHHIVWSIHSTELSKSAYFTRFVRHVCAMLSHFIPDKILCIADAAKTKHVSLGYSEKKMQLFHNGLDFSKLKAEPHERENFRKTFGIKPSEIVIGSLGRFHHIKAYDVFIKSVALLLGEFDNLRVLIVGRGLDCSNQEIMAWIDQTGFSDRIILLGERTDVAICLSSMDLFCLHSRSEGLPTVLAEAMAMTLPCVSTNVGDASILLGDTGILVEKESSQALANGLRQLLALSQDERLCLGARASERVRAEYTIQRTCEQFSMVYSELLND